MRDLELMTLASPDFFEPLARMEVDPRYRDIMDACVPADWLRKEFDVWLFAQPHLDALVAQGFKIHLSATRRNAEALLRTVLPECVARQLPFKIVADPRRLSLMNSKNFDRGSSGKFIVIYPPTLEAFKETLQRLHELTAGQEGPYILSDRRYRDNKVLYYRYGGFWPVHRVEADGRRVPCITDLDGALEPDERLPYFRLPSWVPDPFPEDAAGEAPAENVLNGRYRIEEAITFSNGGGVYKATDTATGDPVILKEARPFSNFWMANESDSEFLDATRVLEREYLVIKKLEGLPSVVQAIELFQEWEHSFLVERFIEGVPLRRFRAREDFIVIVLHDGFERVVRFCEKFRTIALQLIDIVLAVHARRVLLVDVSPNNFLIDPDTLQVTLIDLETSIDLDNPRPGDEVVRVWTTPGSRRPGRLELGEHTAEDDLYALGMVLYSLLVPIQSLFEMYPQASGRFLEDISNGVGLPPQVRETIELLLAAKAEQARDLLAEWDPQTSLVGTGGERLPSRPWERWRETDRERIADRVRRVIPGITSFLLATFDTQREDRLWPADVRVFDTNPLSLACGACGPLLYLTAVGQPVPAEVREWVARQRFREDAYPPGLYWGLAGVACTLAATGFVDRAYEALRQANESPLRFARADLWHGAAGLGWANLWFHHWSRDLECLARAREAGDHLLAVADQRDTGWCWVNPDDDNVHYGLAYGASGVSLFLAQLYQACGDPRYRQGAGRGLAFELASAVDIGGAIRWFNHERAEGMCEPYMEHGSAGVGSAFIRCAALLDDAGLRETAERAERYAFCKWTVHPGQFSGLSGIGEFMLDLYAFTGREPYLNRAYAIAETILHYAVERPEGIAFHGRLLVRLSNDLSTGSAGIGLFLNRLLHPGPRPFVDLDAPTAESLAAVERHPAAEPVEG